MNDDAEAIKDACDAGVADPKLAAKAVDGVTQTYCNFFVQRVANAVGYGGFADLMANEIVDTMSSSADWSPVGAGQAADAATQGLLTIAGHKAYPHGHVAVVYPGGGLVYSGKWATEVPVVASVGERNQIAGANWAFSTRTDPPGYWTWTKKQPDGGASA